MDTSANPDLGFSYRATKGGEVAIHRAGQAVTRLRGVAAREFLAEVDGADQAAQQQAMARATGNYKRGNERVASDHPRNRGRDER